MMEHIELDAMANTKPVKEAFDERRDVGELCDVLCEVGSSNQHCQQLEACMHLLNQDL